MKKISVDVAHSYLADVPKENAFKLWNGKELLNLEELELALNYMPLDIFEHHVNDHKNDFSSWVLHIVKDKELADLLSKEKTKGKMIAAMKKRREELRKIIKKGSKPKKTSSKIKAEKETEVKLPPPKEHEYLRHPNEHIHFGIRQFLWGFILGVLISIALFIWI